MNSMIDVDALYKKYGPMVYRRCKFLLKDEDKALDAMQDVYVLLVRKQKNLYDSGLSSLLYRMATNICLNYIRSLKRKRETLDDELLNAIAVYEDHTRIIESRHMIDSIFREEAADTKTMAVLHYVDGMTLEETAAEVGLSVSGVRKRLRKLKEKSDKFKEAHQNA